MNETKLLAQFFLFAALVLIVVALGKVAAGAFQDKLPGAVYAILSGGASRENPPLGEMLGS
jgi:hypothetical protein